MNEGPHPAKESGGSEDNNLSPRGRQEPSLEEALARIEAIAAKLEAGDLDLEAALKLYREAREMHTLCVARLSEAERELQILMEDGELRGESPSQ